MYAGAVAVPLIIGRALQLSAEEVAMLISADLFCCGLITLIQTLGATRWFGIQLPVMMGVTFASVAPMAAMATAEPGPAGAQLLFGSIIGAGVVSILIAPAVSRMLRFFPPVVTGTIIAVIGITLMRVGINWIFGNPVGPTAPAIVDPAYAKWLADVTAPGGQAPPLPQGFAIQPSVPNRSTPTRSAWASRPWCCCPSCSSSSTRAASSPISRCCWASWSAPSPPRPPAS